MLASLSIFLFLFIPFLYGKLTVPDPEKLQKSSSGSLRVAMIQANIDPTQKWDKKFKEVSFRTFEQMTYRAASSDPDLIIWPETATPAYLRLDIDGKLSNIRKQVDSLNTPLLTGTPDFKFISTTDYLLFNSAFLLKPNSNKIDHYAKMQLVPFGERVPFEDVFGWLNRFDMGQADFTPGKDYKVFEIEKKGSGEGLTEITRFSTLICYESTFPGIVRQFVKRGAQFLVIITNDAWFGKTSGPFQHARMAVLRAVETRRSVARCANTGVSMLIDPYGRVMDSSKIFTEEIISGSIPIMDVKTFYVKMGDIFSWLLTIIAGFFILVTLIYRRKTL